MTDFEKLADDIVASGVKMGFGIPGSGATLSLIDELEKRGVPFHLSHFEGAGAMMAAASGRVSGTPGLSVSIKGPGLANAVPGLSVAWFESYPLVHITEAAPPGAPLSAAHKRLDQQTLVDAVSKASRPWSINGPSWQAMVDYAFAEECGPVVFELVNKPVQSTNPLPSVSKPVCRLEDALKLIKSASRPVVIVGSLGIRHGLQDQLEALSIPVFSTAGAKGVINENLPTAAGVFTGVGQDLTPEKIVLPQSDLVIGIGVTAREVLSTKPFHCDYLAIEASETDGTDAFEPTVRTGLSDANDILSTLQKADSWGLSQLKDTLEKLHAKMDEGFLPGQVFYALQRHFDHNVRMVMDTGYFCTIGEHAWLAKKADQCLLSGQGRYMGTSIPMAIGAAMTDPSIPTICTMGDGGVAMYLAEAKLAVRHKLPILFVLMTDNMFGSIRTRALKDGLTQKPLTMDGTGWVAEFDAMGIAGQRVGSLDAVNDALINWEPSNGPAYLEVAFDPVPYEAMCAGIR